MSLARDPGSGDVSLVGGGCITARRVAGCRQDPRLRGAGFFTGVAISPDGRHVYLTATPSSYYLPAKPGLPFVTAGYAIDPSSGALAPLPGACVSGAPGLRPRARPARRCRRAGRLLRGRMGVRRR